MKSRIKWRSQIVLLCLIAAVSMEAADGLALSGIKRLPSNEIELKTTVSNKAPYRLEVSSDLIQWTPWMTLLSTGQDTIVDSGAPYLLRRYYRAQALDSLPVFTGDHLSTEVGELIIHPVNHASLVVIWNGLTIYNDPVGATSLYKDFPRPDLILVSHTHGDHFDAATLNGVKTTNTVIIGPAAVFTSLSAALKKQTIPLANLMSTNLLNVVVEAVPAYNSNHPKGVGNGYVVHLGGRRLYFAGDTGDVAEMRSLKEIDVAFLCMNVPFTMTVDSAASAVRDFKPRMVYPYHFRNSDGSLADLVRFKRLVGSDLGIEVRIRKWY